MRRRTIQLRSGTWEWMVVDPDDPRTRGWSRAARSRTPPGAPAPAPAPADPEPPVGTPAGAPPLPKRHIELRSTENERQQMAVRVPSHLGKAGDDAAVTMLALNPDRRIVVGTVGSPGTELEFAL